MIETREDFFQRKQKEQEAQWEKEFQETEKLRKQRETRESEEAQASAARAKRERIEEAHFEQQKVNADTEKCSLCGQEVPKVCISHVVYGTDDLCIRKPREARACGRITKDAWDMLTETERVNGYIVPKAATAINAATYKKVTPEPSYTLLGGKQG